MVTIKKYNRLGKLLLAASLITCSFMLGDAAVQASEPKKDDKKRPEVTEWTAKTENAEDAWMEPAGIWVGASGEMIIVDTSKHTIEWREADGKVRWKTGSQTGKNRYGEPLGGYIDDKLEKSLFSHPRDIAVDNRGVVYISDYDNHTIRKIVDGTLYTHAGTGKAGYTDGEKKKAQFNHPSGLAIDKDNNLYVADTMNHVIRKVAPDGVVSTIAGTAAKEGGFQDGIANKALFNEPADVALGDQGEIFVSDSGNHVIRIIEDGKVALFAGQLTAADPVTGYLAGGYRNGNRLDALFKFPTGLHYEQGILFIADSLNNRVRAVNKDGSVYNLAGKTEPGDMLGTIEQAQFERPMYLTYADGKLYVSDSHNRKLKLLSVDISNLQAVQTDEDLIASVPLEEKTEKTQIWFDYQPIQFAHTTSPYYENKQLFIPIRDLFEQWQAQVIWHSDSFEVEVMKEDWSVRFKLKEKQTPIIAGKGYIESAYLERLTKFRAVRSEDHNALIMTSQ